MKVDEFLERAIKRLEKEAEMSSDDLDEACDKVMDDLLSDKLDIEIRTPRIFCFRFVEPEDRKIMSSPMFHLRLSEMIEAETKREVRVSGGDINLMISFDR